MAPEKGIGLARVAEAAGVSVATVSNSVNRPWLVAPQTHERILAAMAALDFVPNRAAATLRQGFNKLIGLVVPEILNPFYAAIAESIAVSAGDRGYALALCVSHDDPQVELRHFEMLAEQRAAGAVVVPLGATTERLNQLRMVGTHLVLIDREVNEDEGCSVVMDDVHGGRLATEHLLAGGEATGITIVNGPTRIPQCAARLGGAQQAMAASANPGSLVELTVNEMTVAEGVRVGRQIAASSVPRSIFCTNDLLAVGVIQGLRDSGLLVPIDARVVGYGDLTIATEFATGVTTVAQPKDQMGAVAVERVLSETVEGSAHAHSTIVFQPTLVVRASAPFDA